MERISALTRPNTLPILTDLHKKREQRGSCDKKPIICGRDLPFKKKESREKNQEKRIKRKESREKSQEKRIKRKESREKNQEKRAKKKEKLHNH